MDPLLRWPGGKRKIAPQIDAAFGGPCKGRYFEPFLGSAAVYLWRAANERVKPTGSILGDANESLIWFHLHIRDNLDIFLDILNGWPKENTKENFDIARKTYNRISKESPRHAAYLLWLNRACFNGLYRENRCGRFNSSIGSAKILTFPEVDHFEMVSELLYSAAIQHRHFRDLLEFSGGQDQVYCDPPYVPVKSGGFTDYSAGGFGWSDHIELRDMAIQAASRGARVVISNHDLPIVREELYPESLGFEIIPIDVRRSIGGRNGARSAGEILATIGPA